MSSFCVSSEYSDETARIHMLVLAFTARRCDLYQYVLAYTYSVVSVQQMTNFIYLKLEFDNLKETSTRISTNAHKGV